MRVYAFEGIDDSLDLVPLAARRALDAAGLKVSLDEWRATTLDARRAMTTLGSEPRVNVAAGAMRSWRRWRSRGRARRRWKSRRWRASPRSSPRG